MALVKRTKKVQDWRKDQLKELRERREKVKRIAGLSGVPEWEDMKSMLESFVEFAKREEKIVLRDMRSSEEADSELVKRYREVAQKQDDFVLVLDLVGKSEIQVEHLNESIKKLEGEFKEAAAELA